MHLSITSMLLFYLLCLDVSTILSTVVPVLLKNMLTVHFTFDICLH